MPNEPLYHGPQGAPSKSLWASRTNIILIGFLAIGGYFLITEHGAHIIPFLPWLLLLACPLMHLFMHHGGHGEHHSGDKTSDRVLDGRQSSPPQP
jgi:hypothetical protein